MRLPLPALLRTAPRPRLQTRAEEMANAASHALACALPLMAWPALAAAAPRHNGALGVVAVAVFCVTMVLVFLASAVYHALPHGRAKLWARAVDHAAIYLFIAGSYTPFTLGVLRGGWGWTLFIVVWSCAALGVAIKLLNRLRHPLVSTGLYVAMGWVAIVAIGPLVARMPAPGIAWLIAGGLSYTLGAIVFLLDNRVRYAHFVWHLFVLGGSVCHFFAALWYAYG